MDWERAKNIIVVFFLLLNITLGAMLFIEDRRYTLAGDQDRLIRTVLNQNGISMYALSLQRFPPMRPLDVTGFYYDTDTLDALLEMFFANPELVAISNQFGGEVFQYGRRRMSITNGFIFFDDPEGFCPAVEPVSHVTEPWAASLAAQFIDTYFPDFVRDDVFYAGGGFRIIYRQQYGGRLVHSNFVEFLITPIGINQVEMQFGQIKSHSGTPVMIFSPDEVLLTFVQRVRHMAQDTPMNINRMDLVYFQEYVSDLYYVSPAVPFYRIFTDCGGGRPFLINAFTNVIID